MIPPRIREFLNTNRPRHLEALKELLSIPSIANVRGTENACGRFARWLERHLADLGLEARVLPSAGQDVVYAEARAGEHLPTVLLCGHYDVQPPDPLELWTSPPFEPQVRDGALYARGANDNKGQLFAHLMAVEAWQKAGGGLPVNLKVLIEGEEEIGSPSMERFLGEHADLLKCDTIVISDSEFFAPGIPAITVGLRGLVYLEIALEGPNRDLHSGLYGGAVANPLNALAQMIGKLHDSRGRVTLEGFYDDVEVLSVEQRREWAELPVEERGYAASVGVDALGGGERELGVLERLWARPTLDCHGIIGGYALPGSKTVIPSRASAKISTRLVPFQDPHRVVEAFRRFVEAHTPPGIHSSLNVHAASGAVKLSSDSAAVEAAQEALEAAFGRRGALIGCGASIPIVEAFQRILGVDAVLMGLGLADDNLHSPNEKFTLSQLWGGSLASAALLGNIARRGR